MAQRKVLLVEDEPSILEPLVEALRREGFATHTAGSVSRALDEARKVEPDLVLLDLMLPDGSGLDVCRELRKDSHVPIIMLTARRDETDRVLSLELGADDYVTKPFSAREVIARIRAVLRRTEAKGDLNVTKNVRISDAPFDFCGAKITPERLEIEFPNTPVQKLGRKELGILAYLNSHPGQVITRKALIHSVWGIHADVKSRSLDQYIVKVRDLFEKNGLSLDCFRTVHGIGYIFDPRGTSKEGR